MISVKNFISVYDIKAELHECVQTKLKNSKQSSYLNKSELYWFPDLPYMFKYRCKWRDTDSSPNEYGDFVPKDILQKTTLKWNLCEAKYTKFHAFDSITIIWT